MTTRDPLAIDSTSPPFDRFKSIQWLAPSRSGQHSHAHVRHHLYVGREKRHPVNVLIKVASKPGLVYQQDLRNEISTLSTVNRELPDSRYFPVVYEHGELDDGRVYLITTLFDEFPLATTVDDAGRGDRLVPHLRTAIEVTRALEHLHGIAVFHVDLNPMNILYRSERGGPVIRIVDFESSYERARHSAGAFYSPPTTPGYTAPEVARQPPDARADVYSLGAVLHTLLSGQLWAGDDVLTTRITRSGELDAELRHALLTAVQPDPARRYATASAFQHDLGAYLERIWPGRAW